jgi:hypothetical protein
VNRASVGSAVPTTVPAMTLAPIVEPTEPPMLRMTVFMPVATPVWSGRTASTMRFASEANASPIPIPSSAEPT